MEENLYPNKFDKAVYALPADYPRLETQEDHVFYIQRNLDQNTVVYALNYNSHGELNLNEPLRIYWKRFEEGGHVQDLNALQTNVAYGINVQMINNDAFCFQFKVYDQLGFFLVKEDNNYRVICKINGKDAILNKIYIDLNISGIFPQGRFYELYGTDKVSQKFLHQKLYF